MPFLHWEVEKRLHRMSQFVQVAKSRKDHKERLRRASTSRYKGKFVDMAKLQQAMRPAHHVTGFETEPRKTRAWKPQHMLAKYLWHAAKLFQIIDEAADGRLIDDHLYASPPLHMRRTLEQFYYWTADDTTHRDRDQVVCRSTRAETEDPEATARLIMVDQLWLWILDDSESRPTKCLHVQLNVHTRSSNEQEIGSALERQELTWTCRYRHLELSSPVGAQQARPFGCSSPHP